MPRLFKYKEPPVRFAGPDAKLARTLLPNLEGNTIDVIKKFPWTLTPYNSPARTETPYIKLKEFYLLDTAINQLLRSYNLDPITGTGTQPVFDALGALTNLGVIRGLDENVQLYQRLYDHTNPTGFEYKLPYFENGQTNINTWTQKSTYDSIVYYQQKLAPFLFPQFVVDAVSPVIDQLPGPNFIKELIKQYLPDVALMYSPNVLEAGAETFTGSATLGQWTQLGGASIAAAFLKKSPLFGRILEIYEKASQATVTVSRAVELIEIALDSSMRGVGGDPVLDKPLIWTTSQPRNFVVAFPLFNTDILDNSNAEQTITRNWELCYLLTYQNLYNKKNLFKGIPPVFYEIEIPGIHYTKAGYVNNLKILNIGNTRLMNLPVGSSGEKIGVNVPDAYFVTMSLIDFFMPSKNFLDTINNTEARNRVKATLSEEYSRPLPSDSTPDDLPFFPGIPPLPGGGSLGPQPGTPGGGGAFGPGGGSPGGGGILSPIGPGPLD